MKEKSLGFLDRDGLKILAMVLMLLDHLWATVIPGNNWMTYVGRLAFPIFAFQAAEGYHHTSSFRKYALRLLIWGLISEIPFNYLMAGGWLYPFHQNTIFTLLLGLWLISTLEKRRERPWWKTALGVLCPLLLSVVGFVDYGWQGVLTVTVFYFFREGRFAKLGQLAGMVVLHVLLMEGQTLPWLFDLPLQSLAVLALIPIWLYNGEKAGAERRCNGRATCSIPSI
jgi:hypothetical protein